MKDLGDIKYFLGLEVAKTAQGIVLSKRKYTLDVFAELKMSNCKPLKLPLDSNIKLAAYRGHL